MQNERKDSAIYVIWELLSGYVAILNLHQSTGRPFFNFSLTCGEMFRPRSNLCPLCRPAPVTRRVHWCPTPGREHVDVPHLRSPLGLFFVEGRKAWHHSPAAALAKLPAFMYIYIYIWRFVKMSVPSFVDKSQFHACRLMFAFKKHDLPWWRENVEILRYLWKSFWNHRNRLTHAGFHSLVAGTISWTVCLCVCVCASLNAICFLTCLLINAVSLL